MFERKYSKKKRENERRNVLFIFLNENNGNKIENSFECWCRSEFISFPCNLFNLLLHRRLLQHLPCPQIALLLQLNDYWETHKTGTKREPHSLTLTFCNSNQFQQRRSEWIYLYEKLPMQKLQIPKK